MQSYLTQCITSLCLTPAGLYCTQLNQILPRVKISFLTYVQLGEKQISWIK